MLTFVVAGPGLQVEGGGGDVAFTRQVDLLHQRAQVCPHTVVRHHVCVSESVLGARPPGAAVLIRARGVLPWSGERVRRLEEVEMLFEVKLSSFRASVPGPSLNSR